MQCFFTHFTCKCAANIDTFFNVWYLTFSLTAINADYEFQDSYIKTMPRNNGRVHHVASEIGWKSDLWPWKLIINFILS